MSTDDRIRPHPKDRLAAPVQHIDLAGVLAHLRAEPHAATSGHRQEAIVKHGALSMVLFAFERGGSLKEHRTDGEVTIHVLRGEIEVMVGPDATVLRQGELLALAAGQPHSLRALDESDMLLTVCRRVAAPVDA